MSHFNWMVTNAWNLRYNTDSEEVYEVSYVNLEITKHTCEIKYRGDTVFIRLPDWVTGIESSFYNGLPLEIRRIIVYRGEDKWILFYQQGTKKYFF